MDSTKRERKINKLVEGKKKKSQLYCLGSQSMKWKNNSDQCDFLQTVFSFFLQLVNGQKVVKTEENDNIHENYALLAKQKNNSEFPQ